VNTSTVIVFGATGAIGGFLCGRFAAEGRRVIAVSRSGRLNDDIAGDIVGHPFDPERDARFSPPLGTEERVSAVVWAQGMNLTDSVRDVDAEANLRLYRANVLYVLTTLRDLLAGGRLVSPTRFCVISSIWQDIARPNKLSYCVTKSALRGMVQSAAIDLGGDGHLINAVLPGPLDTPMTRANLSSEQLARLENATPSGRLPTLSDVAEVVCFLCSERNTGTTGQFIAVDGGFSHAKHI